MGKPRADTDAGSARVRIGKRDVAAKLARNARLFWTAGESSLGEEKRELSSEALDGDAVGELTAVATVLPETPRRLLKARA